MGWDGTLEMEIGGGEHEKEDLYRGRKMDKSFSALNWFIGRSSVGEWISIIIRAAEREWNGMECLGVLWMCNSGI